MTAVKSFVQTFPCVYLLLEACNNGGRRELQEKKNKLHHRKKKDSKPWQLCFCPPPYIVKLVKIIPAFRLAPIHFPTPARSVVVLKAGVEFLRALGSQS